MCADRGYRQPVSEQSQRQRDGAQRVQAATTHPFGYHHHYCAAGDTSVAANPHDNRNRLAADLYRASQLAVAESMASNDDAPAIRVGGYTATHAA